MNMFPFLVLTAAMLGGLGILGWIFTTWLRIKNGYPLDDGHGPVEASRASELLAQENADMRGKMARLEDRLSVLERIATDPTHRLDREIAGLK